jgi:hypothetical protein
MPFISLVNGTMTSAFALNRGAIPLGPGATAPLLNNASTPYVLNNPRLFDSSQSNGYSSYTGDFFGRSIDSNATHVVVGISKEDQQTAEGWEEDTGGGAIFDANTGALLYPILNPNPMNRREDGIAYDTYHNSGSDLNYFGYDSFGAYVSCTDNYAIFSSAESYGQGYDWIGGAGAFYVYRLSDGALIRTIRSPFISQTPSGRWGSDMSLSSLSRETYQDTFTITDSPDAHPITGLTVGSGSTNMSYGGCVLLIDAGTGTVLNTFVAPQYMIETDQSSPWKNGLKRSDSYTAIYGGEFSTSAQNSDYVVAKGPSLVNGQAIVHVFDRLGSNYPIHEIIQSGNFGYAISMNEDYLAISDPYAADDYGDESGKVYIYEVGTWNLLYVIDNPNAWGVTNSDRFGKRTSMDGRYLSIDSNDMYETTADHEGYTTGNGNPTLGQDKTYIYDLTDGSLIYRVDEPVPSATYVVSATKLNDFKLFIGNSVADNNGRSRDGAIYAFNIPTTSDWQNSTLVNQLDNPNPLGSAEGDNYGGSVALSNNLAIVSARYESDGGGLNSGKVYIYDVSDATASSLKYTISNPNAYTASAGDQFGVSVAIHGDYAIVGAPYEDDANGSDSGKAYIFNVGSSGSSTALITLDNPNPTGTSADDNFGSSVAINDDYAIVGSPYEGDTGGLQSGKVYMFDKNNGSLIFTFDNPSDQTANDLFGSSVSISGNILAISAPLDDDNSGTDSGRVYLYSIITGEVLHTISNPNPIGTSTDDTFGSSIDLLGDFLVVGAPYEDDPSYAYADAGKAYLFSSISGELIYTFNNPNGDDTTEDDHFGHAVSLSDSYVIISGHDEDDSANSRTETGKAYFYSLADGLLKHTISNPISDSTAQSAKFSYSVAINNEYAVIGAPGDQFASFLGKVFVYSAEKVIAMGNPTVTLLNNWSTPEITSQIESPYFLTQYDIDEGKGPYSGTEWGNSVVIGGDYIVSGMPLDSFDYTPGGPNPPWEIVNSGRIFVHSATTSELLYDIKPPEPLGTHTSSYNSGSLGKQDRLCVTSNYIIAGYGPGNSVEGNRNKVYFFDIETGNLVHTIQDPELSTDPNKQWPYSMDVSEDGNWLVIACYNRTVNGVTNAGRAYVYDISTKQLVHTFDRPAGVNDIFFGYNSIKITNSHTFVTHSNYVGGGGIHMYENSTGNFVKTITNPWIGHTFNATPNGFKGVANQPGDFAAYGGIYAISSYAYEWNGSTYVYTYRIFVYSLVTGNVILTIDKPGSASSYWGDKITLNSDYIVTTDSTKAYIYSIQSGNLEGTVDRPAQPSDHQYDSGYDWGQDSNLEIQGNTLILGSEDWRYNGSSKSGRITIVTGDMWENAVAGKPTFASMSPASYGGGSNRSFTLTGSKFDLDTTIELIDSNNISTAVTSFTVIDTNTILFNTPKSYTTAEGPLSIKIISSTGESTTEANAIATGFNPVWTTASGNLSSGTDGGVGTNAHYFLTEDVLETIVATDTEDPEVIYTIESGSLPPGCTIDANSGIISGTIPLADIGSDTVYNFTAGVNDSGGNLTTRDFSITVKNSAVVNYTFSSFTFRGTTGKLGPTLSESLAVYDTTTYSWLNNTTYFNVNSDKMQIWQVPATGNYRIKTIGAAGGSPTAQINIDNGGTGGYGSYTEAEVYLERNAHLLIVPGHVGEATSTGGAGGGGGSFVAYRSPGTGTSFIDTDLIFAGGGGGGGAKMANATGIATGGNGSLEFKGGNSPDGYVPGAGNIATQGDQSYALGYGADFGGGNYGGGGGGGWLDSSYGRYAGNGPSGGTWTASGGAGFNADAPLSGGYYWVTGGFGGGGSAGGTSTGEGGGGGGGGYSGGAGDYADYGGNANWSDYRYTNGGGGGGLYYHNDPNLPSISNLSTGINTVLEHGKVIITKL